MSRFQSVDEVYSALFVDFDNIYTRLTELDAALAKTFATNPQRWMRWLEGHALRMMYGDGVRRRILKRCCYLNPLKYQEFRPFFIRSAFLVMDCPPLTNSGKTNADIHLVMDCMDALAHVTRFDEIIILSGDADFTPLLLRIQEHARRSLVLSVGYTSPAYAAACSWRIRGDWFLSQALEEMREEELREDRLERPHEQPLRNGRGAARGLERDTPDYGARGEGRAEKQHVSISLPAYKRIHLLESVKQLVSESQVPVPLPTVAQMLQSEQSAPPDWYGAGTLRDLLEVLDLAPIAFTSEGQGFVYDPDRHERPTGDDQGERFRKNYPELYDFALKVHRLTDLPLFSPQQYGAVLSYLVDEVNAQGFSRNTTVRALEYRCEEEGLPAAAAQLSFVVEAVIRGGTRLTGGGKGGSALQLETVRKALVKSALELCKLSQILLDERGMDMLREWLQSDGE